MQTRLLKSTFSSLAVVFVACGGQAASDAPKAPGTGEAPAAAVNPPAPEDAGPSTTTSMTLGDGGDLQGAKLTEAHTVAAIPAAASPSGAGVPTKGPHSHDPGRGPADIRAIIVAHRDEARGCYDKALLTHPGIEGDLVVQWTIDPKGAVTQVTLDTARSQITEPTVLACIGAVIRKLQFAASPGGFETKAFYPFNFHPRQGSPPAPTTPQ
jgi:hypothetical protein